MASISQAERNLSLTTPLGPDVLLLTSFSGTESLSRLFSYQLDLASADDAIAAKDIVGKPVTWSISRFDQQPRYFNGIVSRFAAGAVNRRKLRSYRAEVVPWPWLLTRTTDCRIFQNQTAPEIITTIFDDFGFNDYSLELKGSFAKREYCVQYRETAFNFISRLMEHEGIFFFFRHEDGKHTMVLANAKSSYADCPESPVEYSPGSLAPNHVVTWEHHYEFRSGKWSRTDYNFETPSTSLLTSTSTLIDLPDAPKFEIFDYPGEYLLKGDGETVTKVRMEEEEAGYSTVSASSQCCTFTPAGKFTLERHDSDSENGEYVITAIRHAATEGSYGSTADGTIYQNSFTCIPAAVIFRPTRATPKPMVQGVQTAVVTGPGGEEIYVDKYGRVKVQFFWDRKGKKDEKSSCWIRVAEQWAGKNWGLVCNPRIGQEVLVDFLEGDPDRPLITGRVYNAEQMPPYDLPANMTQSGIKSRSSKGGSPANYNELRFEDKKGSEMVTLHAEKDQTIEVENDESHWVGHDRSKTVDNDETSHIKHDRTETVDNNETITVHGKRTEEVDKDETITIHQNRTETVDINETISIGGDRTESVSKNESITVTMTRTRMVGINESVTVGGARELTVGGFQAVTVGGYQAFIVGANQSLQVGKNLTENIGGDRGETVVGKRTDNIGKDLQSSIGGSHLVSVKQDELVNVGKNFQIEAGEKIVLQTGDASITMKKDGTIVIKGKDISVKASGKVNVKADSDIALKGSKITEN
ncbi:MAG: type VI secretion system tip protein TssI/VgrG [Isosphaeraceae bacterium]